MPAIRQLEHSRHEFCSCGQASAHARQTEALYAAKRTARDRVMLAPDVVPASAGSDADELFERGRERALDLRIEASAA